MQTFGNLIHSNFRIPGCDYEQLMKITRVLTKNQTDVDAAFRLMVFNIFAHNRDDHVKNFAFMLNESGEWRVTPAYDLTFTHGHGGEHTLTVAGEGRAPDHSHILQVADGAGIKKIKPMKSWMKSILPYRIGFTSPTRPAYQKQPRCESAQL